MIKRTIFSYFTFEIIRFFLQFFIAIIIFKKLSISDYANFAIIQSLSAILAVFLTLNLKSSMQKTYSREGLKEYINFFYSISIPILIITILLLIKVFAFILQDNLNDSLSVNVSIDLLLFYSVSIALNSAILSFYNANKRTLFFNLSSLGYPLIATIFLVINSEYSLSKLLTLLSFAYLSPLLFILPNLKFKSSGLRISRLISIAKYSLNYSIPSFPASGSKLFLEYLARISIMAGVGEVAVAALAIVNTIFSVFRSIERSFFRAVTPYLIQVQSSIQDIKLTNKLVKIQTIMTLTFFIFTFVWLPAVKGFFPEKPDEVFQYELFLLMSVIYVISLWKNYNMAFLKKRYSDIRYFFRTTTVFNFVAAFFIFYLVDLPEEYLSILIIANSLNLLVIVKKRRSLS